MTELAVDRPLDESDLDDERRSRPPRRFHGRGGRSRAFVFERITRVGYCNRDGQEVIRKPIGPARLVAKWRLMGGF